MSKSCSHNSVAGEPITSGVSGWVWIELVQSLLKLPLFWKILDTPLIILCYTVCRWYIWSPKEVLCECWATAVWCPDNELRPRNSTCASCQLNCLCQFLHLPASNHGPGRFTHTLPPKAAEKVHCVKLCSFNNSLFALQMCGLQISNLKIMWGTLENK